MRFGPFGIFSDCKIHVSLPNDTRRKLRGCASWSDTSIITLPAKMNAELDTMLKTIRRLSMDIMNISFSEPCNNSIEELRQFLVPFFVKLCPIERILRFTFVEKFKNQIKGADAMML